MKLLLKGSVRYFKALIVVGIKSIQRICIILYDSKQFFRLLFSHNQVLSEYILLQSQSTLQVLVLLL